MYAAVSSSLMLGDMPSMGSGLPMNQREDRRRKAI